MPAFLTHWRILIATLDALQTQGDAPTSLPELIAAPGLARPRNLGDLSGADIPTLAYLGAVGPDVPYLAGSLVRAALAGARYKGPVLGKSPWADLLHYNRSGDFICEVLRLGAGAHSAALRQRVALYALGYCTHIAGDIIVHPLVNRFAGAYHQQTNPGVFFGLGMHFWVELCHDASTARSFFHRRIGQVWRRPWGHYLRGAARELTTRFDGTSVLDVLCAAAERTYGLDATASVAFRREYLAGIRGMERYLEGRGYYRLLYASLVRTPDLADRFAALHEDADGAKLERVVTFDEVVALATSASTRLCAAALRYMDALTEPGREAVQMAEVYAALRRDLRNWDLDTGYYTEAAPDETGMRVLLRHSWPHFTRLTGAPDSAKPS